MPTKKDVFRAASLLEATHGSAGVTIDGVRLLLGGGSKSDIGPHVKEWRKLRRLSANLPEVVTTKALRFAAELFALARWDAEATAHGTQTSDAPDQAVAVDLQKRIAKVRLQLEAGAELLQPDLLTSPDETLRKLDEIAKWVAIARDLISSQAQIDGAAQEPDEERSRKRQKRTSRADALTAAVERVLLVARRPMLGAEIHEHLSPAMQEVFDKEHFNRTLDSRSRQGKVVRYDADPRKWRHLSVPLPEEKPKRKSYERVATTLAKTRSASTLWANEALAFLCNNSGAWAADVIYERIRTAETLKNVPLDAKRFRRVLNRRCYYGDFERAEGGPYTFQAIGNTRRRAS